MLSQDAQNLLDGMDAQEFWATTATSVGLGFSMLDAPVDASVDATMDLILDLAPTSIQRLLDFLRPGTKLEEDGCAGAAGVLYEHVQQMVAGAKVEDLARRLRAKAGIAPSAQA